MRSKRSRAPRRQKMDLMWAPNGEGDDDPIQLFAGTGSQCYRAVSISAAGMKVDAGGVLQAMGQSAKLYRFDGFIHAFMDATTSGTNYAVTNHTRLLYWWIKEKLTAESYSGEEMTTTSKMDPLFNWKNIMRRRDVMRWGMLDVYGPNESWDSSLPVAIAAPATGPTVSNYPGNVNVNARAVQGVPRDGAMLPFPRLPKGGLNLFAGEVLNLYTQGFSLTDTLGQNARPVLGLPRYRCLISV